MGADIYCPTATQLCCEHNESNGDKTYECTNRGIGACAGGTSIMCDDRSDCPSGQVCCGTFDQQLGYRSVQCQASCGPSPIPNTTTVRFCDGKAPTDECASIGKTCTPSMSLFGYHVCQ
jgi:hypothetical protein